MYSQNRFPRRQRSQQASTFADLYDKLLIQKDRLTERKKQTFQLPEITAQMSSDPQYITGVVQNFRIATQEEKKLYGLEDSNTCYKFFLNNYLVVIATRLPNQYPDKTPVSLYLPTKMTLTPQPQFQDRQLVVISPFIGSQNRNFMDYPYIIVQSQKYLSPSYICSWIKCKRYISLKNYLKSQYQINESTVFGQACHKFLQHLFDNLATMVNKKSFEQFKDVIRSIYNGMLYDFYTVYQLEKKQTDFEYFYNKCNKSLRNIYNWVVRYIIDKQPIENAKYPDMRLTINQVIGSEINVSKYFGLKGKTDGLFKGVRFNVKDNFKQQVYIPFELKTGWKIRDEHQSQIDIYTMLIRQKYNLSTLGLLFYSNKDELVFRSQKPQNAFANIMMQRNVILMDLKKLYLNQKIQLPDFTFNNDPCKVCQYITQCQILHINDQLESLGSNYYKKKYLPPTQKKIQNGQNGQNPQHQKMLQIFDQMGEDKEKLIKLNTPSDLKKETKDELEDLKYPEIKYIKKWMRCLHIEEQQIKSGQEKNRKEKLDNFNIKSEELVKLMTYHSLSRNSLQNLKLTIQKRFFNIKQFKEIIDFYQMGHKMNLSISSIGIIQNCKILSSRRLQQTIELRIELSNKDLSLNKGYLQSAIRDKLVCDVKIDKFDNHQFSMMRNRVFDFVLGPNQKLKRIVIEDYQPRRTQHKKNENKQRQNVQKNRQDQSKRKQKPIEISPQDYGNFNIYQQQAFRKVFSRQYCTLVQGLPGTGKKQLIVRLLNKCNQLNWKVLITTFTNKSLDKIFGRTLKSGKISQQKIIREGCRESIEPRFLKFHSGSENFESIYHYRNYFDEKKFWFVTLASVNSSHIPKEFDLVILDEASRSLEPACIEALNRGAKIVLIGDYKQLQPIVKSTKAASQGMSISLFQRLCYLPDLVVSLRYQFRMNKQIMKLSNQLVYQGQLILGDQQTANKVVKLNPNWFHLSQKLGINDIINPQNPVVFLNHDWFLKQVNGKYNNKREDIVHILEVMSAIFFFLKLLEFGVKLEDITIVCVYNKTVEVIKNYFKRNSSTQQLNQTNDKEESQVLTIDKSQGIDKEVIILLAESRQTTNNILLEDCKRMNVALTRAKTKLIIIGSMDYLEENQVLREKLPPMLRGKKEFSIQQDLVQNVIKQLQLKQNSQNSQNVQRENTQGNRQNELSQNVQR